jgi:4-hydroxybutyryl-CoA dehydratase/vinylacetyl-CoA-Delta-isomerase
MPSYKDLTNPEYGHLLSRYLKAGDASTEARFKAARLSEWLTIGAGVPGCMHGGGSPDGAKLVVRFTTPMEEYVDYARNIIGIEEHIPDPQKPKR